MEVKSSISYRLYSLNCVRPQGIKRLAAFLHEHHPEMGYRCARLLIQRTMQTGWLFLAVLKRTGRVVGILGYQEAKSPEHGDYGLLAPMTLTPSAHRHGIGPWLLRFALLYRRVGNQDVPLFAVPEILPADQRDTLLTAGFGPGDPRDMPAGLRQRACGSVVLRHDPRRLAELAAAVADFCVSWSAPDGTTIRLDLEDLQLTPIGTMVQAIASLGSRKGAWGKDELYRCEG